MNKLGTIIAFCSLILVQKAKAQNRPTSIKDSSGCFSQIIEGDLILAHPYNLKINKEFKAYVTFLGEPLMGEENEFKFKAFKSGELKIYRINPAMDTTLIEKRFLKFEMPELSITLSGRTPGAILERNKLKFAPLHAGLPNSEITYSFPLERMVLKYMSDGKLKDVQLKESFIPATIADEIRKSGTDILILEVTMKFGFQKLKLPPALYYLE